MKKAVKPKALFAAGIPSLIIVNIQEGLKIDWGNPELAVSHSQA